MDIVIEVLVDLLSIFGLTAYITVLNRNKQQAIEKFKHCKYIVVVTVCLKKDRQNDSTQDVGKENNFYWISIVIMKV